MLDSNNTVGPKRRTQLLLSVAFLITRLINCCLADDESIAAEAIQGEFKIAKEGRLILLPVVMAGQQLSFLMDTGACRCGFDTSLRPSLGAPHAWQLLKTPAGNRIVQTYDWPELTLEGRQLKSDRAVVCSDLADFRHATNEKIYGVIGIDLLRNCRLQIDFDAGQIRFLKTLPGEASGLGVRIPVKYAECGAPFIEGAIDDDLTQQFLIDTGAQGNSLESEIFDKLRQRSAIRLGGNYSSITLAGAVEGQRGYLREMNMGGIAQADLRFARANLSTLGLRYFSRFVVTFDFPDSAIYLKRGKNFSSPEPRATSGMNLGWFDEKVVVTFVRKGGPAEIAGIQSDDILEVINGTPAARFDHFQLRHLLTSEPDTHVALRIRRGNDIIDAQLKLAAD